MGNPIIQNLLQKDFRIEVDSNFSLPEMVKSVVRDVGKHIKGKEELRSLLTMLPKGNFTICPDSPEEEQHKYITERYGKIDKSDPRIVLAFMKNFVSEAAALERQAIAYGVTQIKDVTADELVMLTDPLVPFAIDNLWYRWFKELVIPLEILDEAEKTDKKNELKKLMNEYDYTVFIDGKQLAWAQAFSTETQILTEALKRLENQLRDKRIKKYIRSLIRAHRCENIKDLEKRWTEVDYAWIEIPKECRVFPVHGMEAGYEHPYGVSLEWRVMVRLDFGKEEIEEICNVVPKIANSFGADAEVLNRKLDYIDIGVFYTAVWAGTCMNFRYAGQVVPNRQEVMLQGGKIFMDLDSLYLAVERYKKILHKHVSEPTAKILSEYINTLTMTESVAGHEVSHPAGRSEEIDKNLGDNLKLLEEAKATMCGNLVNEARDEENRIRIVAETIARFCRFFFKTTLENPTFKQYLWETMVACNTMHRAGVIKMGDGCIEVDIEKAKSRAWFIELEKFVDSVFTAYKKGDGEALQTISTELCDKDTGIVAEIIALVNKEEENKEE